MTDLSQLSKPETAEPYWKSRDRHNSVCLLILFGPLVLLLIGACL